MMKKLISFGLAAMMLLTACSSGRSSNQSASSQQISGGKSTAAAAADVQETAVSEPEEDKKIVEKYQFVPGYGICEKGNAPIYVMSPENRPVIKEENTEIELLSAIYQDGKMLAKFRTKDYSATAIPEEEAKVLIENEKEYYRKQELGEPVEWDDSYITIDAENGILVRSPFEQRRKEEADKRSGPDEKRYKCIYGEGIPDVGYSFTRATNSYDYDHYLENGYISTLSEYCIEDKVFEVPEPTGVYEIKMPGFTGTLDFEFVPALQIEDLETLSGYISHGDAGIYALGSFNGDGLEIQYYTYSNGNNRVYPDIERCVLEKGGKTYERMTQSEYWSGTNYTLNGIGKGSQGDRLLFQVPEAERGGDFTLRIPQVRLTSQELSEVMEIGIPENEAVIDKKIEFTDSTIIISKAKRMEEPVFYGNINGEDVKKPAVYLAVEIEEKTADKRLIQVLGTRPDTKHKEEASPYMSYMTPDFDSSGEPKPYGRLIGFYAFYEEGDQKVQVQFRNPSYLWNQEFALTVGVTEQN